MSSMGLLNYGSGNILSVERALKKVGQDVKIISTRDEFKNLSHLIIPGVGAFSAAMTKLNNEGFIDLIIDHAHQGKKLLGICVGMQILYDRSYEFGNHIGLGLLRGDVKKIDDGIHPRNQSKVPNIGWRSVKIACEKSKYFSLDKDYFYHIHSFSPMNCIKSDILGTSNYAGRSLTVLVKRDNIIGSQFHPEKSGEAGLEFLRKFCSTI